MRALARLPAAHGIAAMQSINIAVVNPWFMTVFMGTSSRRGQIFLRLGVDCPLNCSTN